MWIGERRRARSPLFLLYSHRLGQGWNEEGGDDLMSAVWGYRRRGSHNVLGRRGGAALEIYGNDEMSEVKEAASCSGHGGIPSVGDAGGGGRYGALDLMTSIKGLGR